MFKNIKNFNARYSFTSRDGGIAASAIFKNNKMKVAELTDVKSKLLRNRIAGYITRRLSPKLKDNGSDVI